ncbi:uncharacterized protein A1O9_06684, partial [Exophiala aquamarina CBS 119918]
MSSAINGPHPQISNSQDSITTTGVREQEANENNKAVSLEVVPGRTTSIVVEDALNCPDQGRSHDGGYGWVCVASMFFISANTWGVNGAFGVYLAYYFQKDTFPGTTETSYAFIGGLAMSQVTFIAPLVTFVGRKLGTRTTLSIGIILESAALLASSFATKAWHLFLAQGICFGWGCSFLYVGSVGIVPQWFDRRRSFATAIAAAGSGVGGLAYSLGTEAMIRDINLAWAFRITAIISGVMNVACTLLMRDRNKHIIPNQKAFDVQLLKRYEFLLILTWAFFSTFGFTLILFTLPDNALQIGLTLHQGAIAAALVNLGMVVGRPLIGYISDDIGRINVVTAATFLCSLFSLCIWTSATTYSVLLVFAFLGGTVCGTFWAMLAPLLADVLGLKLLPASLSIVWFTIVVPTTFGEPIALKLRRTGAPKYLSVQLFAGFLFLAATICMVVLRSW